jgi:membrane protease YdiL (CAAX protease family)
MFSPSSPLSQPILVVVSVVIVALLVYNTLRQDSRPYRRFTKFRSSWKRRRLMRKWLIQAFQFFGILNIVVLLCAWQYIGPLLDDVNQIPFIDNTIGRFEFFSLASWGILLAVIAVVVLGPLAAMRWNSTGRPVAQAGEVRALLPRNKSELRLVGLLSLNAAIMEELLFRLALPALLFGATNNAVVAVVLSTAIFASLHAYQGVFGVLTSGLFGAVSMAIYIATGSIVLSMLLHALWDLRTLVAVPVLVGKVHRLRARW